MADSLLARAELRLRDGSVTGPSGLGLVPLDGVTMEVDGTRVAAARGVEVTNGWLIEIPTDVATIYVEGHGLPRDELLGIHGLQQVVNLEPLFAGRLELLQRLRG